MKPILVVEDDEDSVELLSAALNLAGYDVISAEDGQQALHAYENQPEGVSLLVTDLAMPGLDGFALAETIRRRDPRLKILFVSAYTDLIDRSRWPDAAILTKPFDPNDLIAQVFQLLRSGDNA
jgi:DNA-binding response OmpR family regulator